MGVPPLPYLLAIPTPVQTPLCAPLTSPPFLSLGAVSCGWFSGKSLTLAPSFLSLPWPQMWRVTGPQLIQAGFQEEEDKAVSEKC